MHSNEIVCVYRYRGVPRSQFALPNTFRISRRRSDWKHDPMVGVPETLEFAGILGSGDVSEDGKTGTGPRPAATLFPDKRRGRDIIIIIIITGNVLRKSVRPPSSDVPRYPVRKCLARGPVELGASLNVPALVLGALVALATPLTAVCPAGHKYNNNTRIFYFVAYRLPKNGSNIYN